MVLVMNDYVVYVHTFPNGKRYVGITCQDIQRRWRGGRGYEGQPVFDAILKYGWDNIRHEIIATDLTKEEAEDIEIRLIKEYHSLSHENGYNIETGGNSTKRLSEETKKKISEKKKGKYGGSKHWHYGQHWSEEVKDKIRKARTGYKTDEKTLKQMSIRMSGKNNPMYGTKMTKEHKAKLQEACVKATSKPVICIETRIIYKSSAEAQRETGINSRTIGYVVNHNPRYKTAGGYHWEYYKENEI